MSVDHGESGTVLRPVRLLDIPAVWDGKEELEEQIVSGQSCRLARILSRGHRTPEGRWYDQDHDEWVAILQGWGSIRFDGGRVLRMEVGDAFLIRAHYRHRVDQTSSEPPCVWIALHLPPAGSAL